MIHILCVPVLWIRDILVQIRIRESAPLTNRFGSGSCYIHPWPSRYQQKTIFIYIIFLRKKFIKKSQKRRNQGSGSRSSSGSEPISYASEEWQKGFILDVLIFNQRGIWQRPSIISPKLYRFLAPIFYSVPKEVNDSERIGPLGSKVPDPDSGLSRILIRYSYYIYSIVLGKNDQ